MALEQIRAIRKAEDQADSIRRDGISTSKERVSNGEKEAAQLLEEAHRLGEESYKRALDQAERDAQLSYRDIISKAKEEIHHKMLAAEVNADDAVSIIVRRVVG